jgi:broad specificity phosphatase PhoE
MLNIYMTRHGQDEDNANGILNGQRDTSLTDLGFSQVNKLVKFIEEKGIIFNKIYTSPLKRTCATASKLAEDLENVEIEILDDLIERDFGIMTGKKIVDIEKFYHLELIKTEKVKYFLKPKNGETFLQLINRARRVLDFIKNKHDNGNILLVTHGDIGKILYAVYYNLKWEDVLRMFHFGNSDLILLSPEIDSEEAHVLSLVQYNS